MIEIAVIAAIMVFFLGQDQLKASTKAILGAEQKVSTATAKIESLVYPEKDLRCSKHEYGVHVFSTAPLIIYIDGFLSDDEAEHLIHIR